MCIDSSIGCRCSIIRCSTDSCIVILQSTKRNSNMIDDLEYHSSTSSSDWWIAWKNSIRVNKKKAAILVASSVVVN